MKMKRTIILESLDWLSIGQENSKMWVYDWSKNKNWECAPPRSGGGGVTPQAFLTPPHPRTQLRGLITLGRGESLCPRSYSFLRSSSHPVTSLCKGQLWRHPNSRAVGGLAETFAATASQPNSSFCSTPSPPFFEKLPACKPWCLRVFPENLTYDRWV